ncbi:MAG: helix-turn-helix domain-containing protein [Candidatus Bathyarchaeota archaeon]|nr:helix-turn-helix domain-containing protein [Candidatus Bathyarchaeota archaeon]
MSSSKLPKKLGTRILEALASSIRIEILRLLHEEGPLSYSELMDRLNLDPVKHAGRFAYHLKKIQSANLITLSKEGRKYQLTDLGWKVYELTREIEEYALRVSTRLLVRTSRTTIEEFDRNRIVDSLVKEAQLPQDVAERIARKAEERLLDLRVKYLTAPLIREFVNAILIEEGMEEYRHRLTRLGLPVYDVKKSFQDVGIKSGIVRDVRERAGEAVLREYVLLDVLPRRVADSHLSGYIDIKKPGSWILHPDIILHDIEEILDRYASILTAISEEGKLTLSLACISKFLRDAYHEIREEQILEYFNVYLAPYIAGVKDSEIDDSLSSFLIGLSDLKSTISLGLELGIPDFMEGKRVPGKKIRYGDLYDESYRLLKALLKCYEKLIAFDGFRGRLPRLIVKLRGSLDEEILFHIHKIISLGGEVTFSNLTKTQGITSSEGVWIKPDEGVIECALLRKVWIGGISLNIPRASYESHGRESIFARRLEKICRDAVDSLMARYSVLSSNISANLLPTIFGGVNPYSNFKEYRCSLNLVGLLEAAALVTGSRSFVEDETLEYVWRIISYLDEIMKSIEQEVKARIALSSIADIDASTRLADMDRLYYGKAKEYKDTFRPFYTSGSLLPLDIDISTINRVRIEAEFHRKIEGALAVIPLGEDEADDLEALKDLTLEISENYDLRWYSYGFRFTYCNVCHRWFKGFTDICQECKSSRSLTRYVKIGASYIGEHILPDNMRDVLIRFSGSR